MFTDTVKNCSQALPPIDFIGQVEGGVFLLPDLIVI